MAETKLGEAPPGRARTISSCWILTDGKAGDLVQCRGIAQALEVEAEIRTVAPRPPWVWLMPFGPIDPRDAPSRPGSPIAPPFPDLVIASGRRTVAYLRAVRKASAGRTFTVFLKDPRIGRGSADFLWVQTHDRLRGENVMATLTAPHDISAARLAAARTAPPDFVTALPRPRIAVLLGGDSAHYRFDAEANARLARALAKARAGHPSASFLVTPSRRTPPATLDAARTAIGTNDTFIWDGSGENPYLAMLANADHVIVTADSANMVSEALSAGVPVHIFVPTGGTPKFRRFLAALKEAGMVREFDGELAGFPAHPVDATPGIAAEIARRYALRRR